jgi:hypothetical protein
VPWHATLLMKSSSFLLSSSERIRS